MGRSWESMIIENIIQGFHQSGLTFDPYYYRTGAGAEIDLIIESAKGILPIKIKFAQKINERDLRPLKISSKKETVRSVGSYTMAKGLNGWMKNIRYSCPYL